MIVLCANCIYRSKDKYPDYDTGEDLELYFCKCTNEKKYLLNEEGTRYFWYGGGMNGSLVDLDDGCSYGEEKPKLVRNGDMVFRKNDRVVESGIVTKLDFNGSFLMVSCGKDNSQTNSVRGCHVGEIDITIFKTREECEKAICLE